MKTTLKRFLLHIFTLFVKTYLSILIEKSVFFSQRDEMPLLSEQQKKIEDALVPFPLYCCVHVKHNIPAKEYCGEEVTGGSQKEFEYNILVRA